MAKEYDIKLGIDGFQYTAWIHGHINETEKDRLEQFISNSDKKNKGTIKIYQTNIDYGGCLLFSPLGKYGKIANFFRKNKDSIEIKLTEIKKAASITGSSRLEITAKDL